jgi:uncharacterized repeat protein (TIGR03803 family)
VIRDKAGNFYGTTLYGGPANSGVVYKLDPGGNETVLYSFSGSPDGNNPRGSIAHDPKGNIYGAARYGGAANEGIVFRVNAAGQEKILYSFAADKDGVQPYAGVICDSAGNIYGTTLYGGSMRQGAVYKMSAAGHESILYSFAGELDGANPYAGVIRDSSGNLYGTTEYGGSGGAGVVYKLDKTGQQTALYSFDSGTDGGYPYSGVILDSSGNLYGTTSGGGYDGWGVVYKIDTNGNESALYTFTGGADGGEPYAGVIRDAAGNLYGTTYGGGSAGQGVVYKVDTSGHETVLYSFTGGADGGRPYAGVIRDAAGNLYGTANIGGSVGCGEVYKIDPTGHETVLYNFTCGKDGGSSYGGVVRDKAGNLYGTTYLGGSAGWGVVYKLDTTGHESVLYTFTGGSDGGEPYAGVIRDSAGNLYGTTEYAGAKRSGVVFRIP